MEGEDVIEGIGGRKEESKGEEEGKKERKRSES